ncbi:MAG: hypothetical protein IPM61_09940 [Chlorobi bacterium]|nr:hypothetical protein [Chlorobiota bacterium]MBX7215675.1 hypothetical protein [Candidatus Kapabacteria bacterium]
MFRPITILLTLLAFLFHTLGVPVTLHACRMEREAAARGQQKEAPACSACKVAPTSTPKHSNQKSFRSIPCCTYKTIAPDKVDSALPKVQLPEPAAGLHFATAAVHDLLPRLPILLYRHAADLPPPDGIVALARTAYLRNATLLI